MVENLEECSICLEYLCNDENITETQCNHIFHKKCISLWLTKSNDCPLCNSFIKKPHNKYCIYCNVDTYKIKHLLCGKCHCCIKKFSNKHYYCNKCKDCFPECHIFHNFLDIFRIN
jgi:hypothetical protein